jgi:hypothetical protein
VRANKLDWRHGCFKYRAFHKKENSLAHAVHTVEKGLVHAGQCMCRVVVLWE